MPDNIFIKIAHPLGKFIYHTFNLSRFECTRNMAFRFLTYMMSAPYNLLTTLDEFSPPPIDANQNPWRILNDVTVTGGTRLMRKEDQVFLSILQNKQLYDSLKIFKLQEEAQYKFRINQSTKEIFLKPYAPCKTIEDLCFSALSPFSSSWVHWLFEILPQLADISQSPYQNTVKILIEQDAPAQIYETITTFFPEKNIIKIIPNEHITCHKLLVSSHIPKGWSVLWGRDIKQKLTETFVHDMEGIMKVREAIYKQFNISDSPPQNNVFIRRKATFRFIHNEQQIADYLLTKQYSVIEPSAMNFREQVECFSNTKVIVAQSGASLANIIFMKPGSTVVCMAAKSSFLNYDYFLSIAEKLGISFLYLLGEVDDEKKYSHKLHLSINHPLNASFTIKKELLESTLDNNITTL